MCVQAKAEAIEERSGCKSTRIKRENSEDSFPKKTKERWKSRIIKESIKHF